MGESVKHMLTYPLEELLKSLNAVFEGSYVSIDRIL